MCLVIENISGTSVQKQGSNVRQLLITKRLFRFICLISEIQLNRSRRRLTKGFLPKWLKSCIDSDWEQKKLMFNRMRHFWPILSVATIKLRHWMEAFIEHAFSIADSLTKGLLLLERDQETKEGCQTSSLWMAVQLVELSKAHIGIIELNLAYQISQEHNHKEQWIAPSVKERWNVRLAVPIWHVMHLLKLSLNWLASGSMDRV